MNQIWEGIDASSHQPQRVWFAKGPKDIDPWLPLRKCDCKVMNEAVASASGTTVKIEFGRATADIKESVIRYNFYDAPVRKLANAIWFIKDTSEKKKGENLIPIVSRVDEEIVESLYQEGVKCQNDEDDDALKNLLKKQVDLKDDDSNKVFIAVASGGSLRMRKKPQNFISGFSSTDLRRGYGNYIVDGEKEECALGPVRHLSYIIHGIGEAVWSREDVPTSGLIDEINALRCTTYKKMYEDWKLDCKKADGKSPPPPNRIEFIPIEWYEQIHSSSSALKRDLISTTLSTIPKIRNLANDVLFDVLVYNTPEFCEQVLNCVTRKISDSYQTFILMNEDFVKIGGTCSIAGHSLGSVITWDLLSILSDHLENSGGKGMNDLLYPFQKGNGTHDDPIVIGAGQTLSSQDKSSQKGNEASKDNLDESPHGKWGPSLPKRITKTLPFTPSFTFLLGSPIGLFLTLRGARPHFHDMLQQAKLSKKNNEGGGDNNQHNESAYHDASPFSLSTRSLYNIFSPSDPVAYKIEPLLLPLDDQDAVPPPCYLVPEGEGVRLHVTVKETLNFRKAAGVARSFLNIIPDKIGTPFESDASSKPKKKNKDLKWKFALGGESDRVDYQLQPGVTDNEYIAAITAHTSYMKNDDLITFWIGCVQKSHKESVLVL